MKFAAIMVTGVLVLGGATLTSQAVNAAGSVPGTTAPSTPLVQCSPTVKTNCVKNDVSDINSIGDFIDSLVEAVTSVNKVIEKANSKV